MNVGILGGGQLGRMIALAGYPLGIPVRLFETSADACGGQVAELSVGEYLDHDALERFADGLDVVTYEFENVPVESANFLRETTAGLPATTLARSGAGPPDREVLLSRSQRPHSRFRRR